MEQSISESAILIAGPTASGKSALALELAERVNGVIINTDSMQVYRDLRVLTARPSAAEEARAPHRLYGFLDAAEPFSVGGWLERVENVLRDLASTGQTPIFLGGTGLYFQALTEGMSPIPDVPVEDERAAEALLNDIGWEALHQRLLDVDPMTAQRLAINDRQRLVRAWSVWHATGRSLTDWHQDLSAPLVPAPAHKIAIIPDRAWLYPRIDARFEQMVGAGALEEVKALAARQLSPRLPAMRALGVPHFLAHLRGDLSLDEAIEKAKTGTRRYAKRQMTWFRNQMMSWKTVYAQDSESLHKEIFHIICK